MEQKKATYDAPSHHLTNGNKISASHKNMSTIGFFYIIHNNYHRYINKLTKTITVAWTQCSNTTLDTTFRGDTVFFAKSSTTQHNVTKIRSNPILSTMQDNIINIRSMHCFLFNSSNNMLHDAKIFKRHKMKVKMIT